MEQAEQNNYSRQAPEVSTKGDFPRDGEQFIGTLVQLLIDRARPREVAYLTAGDILIEQTGHDNWDGGIDLWSINVALPLRLHAQLTNDERELSEKVIEDAANVLFRALPGHWMQAVVLAPYLSAAGNWREHARRFLNAEGVSNQGRVRTDNIATREVDGLLFRSEPEVHVYRALKARGVLVAPLPVFLRGGDSYRRTEPDFVLLHGGRLVVLEIDGENYHHETPALADRRLRMFKEQGAHVHRIDASDCNTRTKAENATEELLESLERMLSHV